MRCNCEPRCARCSCGPCDCECPPTEHEATKEPTIPAKPSEAVTYADHEVASMNEAYFEASLREPDTAGMRAARAVLIELREHPTPAQVASSDAGSSPLAPVTDAEVEVMRARFDNLRPEAGYTERLLAAANALIALRNGGSNV